VTLLNTSGWSMRIIRQRYPSKWLRLTAAISVVVGTGLVGIAIASAEPTFSIARLMPPPVGSTNPPRAPYSALSCATTTRCTAAGPWGYFDGEGKPSVDTLTSGTWGVPKAVSLPVGAHTGVGAHPTMFNAISCTDATDCVTVGQLNDSTGATVPMIANETSGSWGTAFVTSLPANALTGKFEYGILNSISCTSLGNCEASGHYIDPSYTHHVFEVAESSGSWGAPMELTLPSSVGLLEAVIIGSTAVSCSSTNNCTVIASLFDGLGLQTVSWMQVAGNWAAPVTLSAPSSSNLGLSSISCPAAGFCIAVGDDGFGPTGLGRPWPVVAIESSGIWSTAKRLAFPLLSPATNGGALSSISCASSTVCVAVGDMMVVGTTRDVSASVTYSNGKWSSIGLVPATPTPTGVGNDSLFSAVSCASVVACVAVGASGLLPITNYYEPWYSDWVNLNPVESVVKPGSPSAVTSKVIVGSATIYWHAPLVDGGSPITSFMATATSPGLATKTCVVSTLHCKMVGFTAHHIYEVVVTARNSSGASKPSGPAMFTAR